MASAGWRRNALRLLVCLVSVAGCVFQASAARDVGDSKSPRSQAPVLDTGPRTKRAYATFVYGEAFLLGVRVLGQSIRESATDLDMVVVAAGKISDSALATLAQDGWRVKTTDIVYNPALGPQSTGFPPAFWGVYTKLSMFNLSEYESVLYLDADTIVVNNAEDAFACPGFCAALRHSERFNSGVMKINPSTALYEDMMRKIKELPSYTGGDQGFLNAYFDGFYNGLVFDPSKDYSDSHAKYMRLPTLYNADIGLYVSNSGRWHVDESQIRVVHYTLGPLKPWDWWTSWLVTEQKKWKELRSRLPRDSRGRSKGRSLRQEQAEMWLPIIPPLVVLLLWMRGVYCVTVLCTRFRNRASSQYSKVPDGGQLGGLKEGMVAAQGDLGAREVGAQPALLPLASIPTGFTCLIVAALLTLQIIPHEVEPFWGWLLTYEWTVFLAALWYAGFLRFCFFWGFTGRFSSALAYTLGPLCSSCVARPSRPSSPIVAAGKANTPSLATARQQTCVFLLLGVLLLVMCPKLASLLHAPSLVTKVVLTGVGGIIASIYLTYAFVSVSQLWYHCGQGSVHASR